MPDQDEKPDTTQARDQTPAAAQPQALTPEDLDAVLRAAGVDRATVQPTGLDHGVGALADQAIGAGNIDLLKDVTLDVRIELGRAWMPLADVLRLGAGSVLTLDKQAGDAVEVLVNGQLVARGEVMVLDENFCVRITEIVSPPESPKA